MTERLSATGKNMLERGRRLLLPPPSPSFPHAYTHLLLDPADRLDAAWGARLSAPNAFATEAADQYVEPGTAPWHQSPASAFSHPASETAHAKPSSARVSERAPLRSTPHATSRTARRAMPSSSSAPLRSSGDSEARAASPETSTADDSSHTSSTSPSRPETVSGPSKNIRVAAPPEAFARHGFDQTTDSKTEPKRRAPSETSPPVSETVAVPHSLPRPVKVTAAPNRSAPLRPVAPHTGHANATGHQTEGERIRARISSAPRADASPWEGEHASSSGLHFAQSPSRLASVLNANLASPEHVPGGLPAGMEQAAPSRHAERLCVAPEGLDARQGPDAEARSAGGVSVEALLEELYERLRLEFLRTYGTSGE